MPILEQLGVRRCLPQAPAAPKAIAPSPAMALAGRRDATPGAGARSARRGARPEPAS